MPTPIAVYRYGYYLRFVLGGWMFLAAFPFIAFVVAPEMLAGLFIIRPFEAAVFGFVLGLALQSFGVITDFVLIHAPDHFDLVFREDQKYRSCLFAEQAPRWARNRRILELLQVAPALVLFSAIAVATSRDVPADQGRLLAVIEVTVGATLGLFGSFLLLRPMLRGFAVRAVSTASQRVWRSGPRVEESKGASPESVVRKRGFVILLSWSLGYLYLQVFAGDGGVPSLTLLVVIVTWLTWMLAFVAFFVDRMLVPIALVAVVLAVSVPDCGRSDNVFEVSLQPTLPDRTTPMELVRDDGEPLVFVAASGGGIQASAWTAHVLRTLTEKVPGFRKRIRLISSVSGGSVGTMFYLNEELVRQNGQVRSDASNAEYLAERTGLNAVAFGLAYRDLWRPLTSWLFRMSWYDRGYYLERAWARDCAICDWHLSDLRQRLNTDGIPNIVFNATAVETGRPVYLGTAHIPSRFEPIDHLSGWDMRLSTAARVSASFPYVSPAARPMTGNWDTPAVQKTPISFHFVDGGYLDNYGVSAVVNVLDAGLTVREITRRGLPKRIIILRIEAGSAASEFSSAARFNSQTMAPFMTLLRVRDAEQRRRNDSAITDLERRWARSQVTIQTIRAVFPLVDVPLSWQLTGQQKRALHGTAASAATGDTAAKMLVAFSDSLLPGNP